MNINQKICDFQNCFVTELNKWIDKLNHGENSLDDDFKILTMFTLIDTLMTYDFHPTRKVKVRTVLVPECDILKFNPNSLILYKTKCIDLDPEMVNCLKKEDLCGIIEQLSIICENCNCNC